MNKIIIIGAGISGLTAGIYAQKCGFESVIYEKNSNVGGLCTSWNRDEFCIDGSIQWLCGTKPNTSLNNLWNAVGAFEKTKILHPEDFYSVDYKGQKITLWRDLNRFYNEALEIAPEDSEEIEKFVKYVEKLKNSDMFYFEKAPNILENENEKNKALKVYYDLLDEIGSESCYQYAKRFSNKALSYLIEMFRKFSIIWLVSNYAYFCCGNAGVPEGGSLRMAMRMEEKYKSLGGKIFKNFPVKNFIIEKDSVTGIVLENGQKYYSDYFISSCAPWIAFDKILNRKSKDLFYLFDSYKHSVFSFIYIAFDVSVDLSDYPRKIYWELDGIEEKWKSGMFVNYSYDKSFAPKGHTIIISNLSQTENQYDLWDLYYKDKDLYNRLKLKIAANTQKRIELKYPEFKGKIKLLDVATPVTFNRYTGAYKGAFQTFYGTFDKLMHNKYFCKIDYKNLYLTGQWTLPFSEGGCPVALLSGKFVVENICKDLSIPFAE